ncbi:MAG: NADPH dehydrogenase, partial [Proteobacteria bacterium]|nr:NADPH dehydrogenase [Pseudomonadota bacterium]
MTAARHDQYRENVAGRANVEDTADLVAYYNDLEKFEAAALWTVANKIP